MKHLLLAITLLVPFIASAQWSTDPATPLVVASAAGAPEDMNAFSDGADGWFVFWNDKRTDGTHFEIFGQHLDAEGQPLWTPGGQLIHHDEGASVGEVAGALMADGSVMLAFIASPVVYHDTLRALRITPDGAPVWDQPVRITSSSTILGLSDITMIPIPGGAIIGWYDTYIGGSNGINVTRITVDGEVLWAPDGYAIPNANYGPFDLVHDGASGVIVNWRVGNGFGSGFRAMRVDSSGTNAWSGNVDTNAGGSGFGGDHQVRPGTGGSLLLAYADNANKIRLAELDTTGALVFDPSPVMVCAYASIQDKVSVLRQGTSTTLVWGDGRPPASNYDVYMQRIDASGAQLLDPDGVLVMHLNTYIPTTGLVPSLNGGVIATIDGNVDGYSAMRINADGTPAWPDPVAFCTVNANPFYSQQMQAPDGAGGIVSFWTTTNKTIHGGRIHANGELGNHIGIREDMTVVQLVIHPNPATSTLSIQCDDAGSGYHLSVIHPDGRVVMRGSGRATSTVRLDVSHLSPGPYTIALDMLGGTRFARFIKE